MIDKTISHYKILEKLGEGGMGVIYKAKDTKLNRFVALKFLPPELTRDPVAKKRFILEAQAAAVLNHPNICTIYEIDESQGRSFITMEYVEGQSLKDRIKAGSLKLDEVLNVAIQVAEGLNEAHEKGIIHRDIKSANIMITTKGQTKIMDFGLAKALGEMTVTKGSTTLGTIAYMSPEQAQAEEIDYRSDIWSLGVVLYEMLTGQLPFKGDYEQVVIYFIINRKPKAIAELRAGIPEELERIVNKSLEKAKEDRYQHIDELMTDLRRLKRELETIIRIDPFQVMREGFGNKGHKQVAKKEHRINNIFRYIDLFRLPKRILIPVGIVLLLIFGFILFRSLLVKRILVLEPKSIAVISFVNETGDKAYDYLQAAVPNLLITSLEQSKYLRVTTWERMYDLLKQMGKEDVEIIDKDLGLELCRIDGIDVIVLGNIIKTGDMFTTDIVVLDADSKRLLKRASTNGKGVASILKSQIDELSREISRGVGISDRKIDATQLPIAEVTTSSMDAYNYFLRGREDWEKYYIDDARQFLEKAVQLDSTFAVANLYLASVYAALGNTMAMINAYEKAKVFAQRATDKERLYIEADYANIIEGDPEKSFRILKQMAQLYPKEKRVHFYLAFHYRSNNLFYEAIGEYNRALKLDPNYGESINDLAYTYSIKGDFDKAIEYLKMYALVSPGDANPFDSMAEVYFRMGKLNEAIKKYREALEVRPDFYYTYWSIGYIYALKEDYPKAMKWFDQSITMAPSPGIKAEGYVLRGFYHYWLGCSDQSISDLRRATSLAQELGNKMWIAYADWLKGWIHYNKCEFEDSRRYFKGWFDFIIEYPLPDRLSQSLTFYKSDSSFYIGLIDLNQGQVDSTKSRLARMKNLLPKIDLAVRNRMTFFHNLLYGEVLLAENSIDKAIHVCENASSFGIPPYMRSRYILLYNVPFPCDVLARAYFQKEELDKAIAEYERLITFDPNSKDRRLIHPKYHYRLAKLYEEKGWSDKALEQYEKFLEIWKDADEELTELVDAKARLKALKKFRQDDE